MTKRKLSYLDRNNMKDSVEFYTMISLWIRKNNNNFKDHRLVNKHFTKNIQKITAVLSLKSQ